MTHLHSRTDGSTSTSAPGRSSHLSPWNDAPSSAGDREFLRLLVRAYAQGRQAADFAADAAKASPRISSWSSLEGLLRIHRCSAVAYKILSDPAVREACAVPAETIERLRARYVSSFTRSATDRALLAALVDAFDQAGIPVLTIKGLVVGEWLYGDPALREYDDIDLLAPANQAGAADTLLSGLGYVGGYRPPLYFGEAPATADYRGDPGKPHVDLSFDPLRIFWPPELAKDPFSGWLTRRQQLSIGGKALPTLGPEDQFIHLARHLQFHDYFRANWFLDLLLLLRQHGDELDWPLIGQIAGDYGLCGGLHRSLELAASGYDADVPESAWRALRPSVVVRRLHRRIWPDSIAVPRDRPRRGGSPIGPRFLSPRGTHPTAGLALLVLDRNRGRNLRYLAYRVVPPSTWLQDRYVGSSNGRRGYWSLLLKHWRALWAVRSRVRVKSRVRMG